jgi:hypothetical protein
VDGRLLDPDSGGSESVGSGAKEAPSGAQSPRASVGGGGGFAPSSPRSPGSAQAGCCWMVHLEMGRSCLVEYFYDTMDILVNDMKASVEGEFVEEEGEGEGEEAVAGVPKVSGVRYKLLLGSQLLEGMLTVIPSATGRGPPECVLVVRGVIIKRMPPQKK